MTGHRVAVVGGGPAGLVAAEVLADAGHAVMLVDHMSLVGRKLLLAGRGGLNLTNNEPLEVFLTRYTGSVALAPAIERFTPTQLRLWAQGLGHETFVGTSGRVFPASFDARPLLRSWIERLRSLGVQFHRARLLDLDTGPVRLRLDDGEQSVEAAVLALGGASWPRLGADGSWVPMLAAHGVEVMDLEASNCGWILDWPTDIAARFAGLPLKNLAARAGTREVRGEAMIDEHGIEGGVVYGLGPELRAELRANGAAVLHLDLRPQVPARQLTTRLASMPASLSLANRLRRLGLTPQAAALVRMTVAERGADRSAAAVAGAVKDVELRLRAPMPIAHAISTAGGIAAGELDERFMLHRLPGVFAAGEMLDWDAPTGGYLLQGCMATGRAAADGVNAWLRAGGGA